MSAFLEDVGREVVSAVRIETPRDHLEQVAAFVVGEDLRRLAEHLVAEIRAAYLLGKRRGGLAFKTGGEEASGFRAISIAREAEGLVGLVAHGLEGLGGEGILALFDEKVGGASVIT